MKKKYKVLVFSILLVLMIGNIAATQYVAAKVNYDPLLGSYLFKLGDMQVYSPMQFWTWWSKFGHDVPNTFQTAFNLFLLIVAVGVVIASVLVRKFFPKQEVTHGSARWATKKEIKESSLLEGKGVFLGKTSEGEYLRHDGPHHILTIAPTRSGKGVGLIIPTLLTWPHSTIITDIKGENWGITAGYRKEKLNNIVLKFEPTAFNGSARYNPLDEIRIRTPNEIRDIQNIVNILIDPEGQGITGKEDSHWKLSAASLLTGIILHLKYTEEHPSIATILSFMANPEKPIIDALNEMLFASHDPEKTFIKELYNIDSVTHPMVAQTAQDMLDKPDKEFASIVSTAQAILAIYRDPILAKNTAVSDFLIEDLMNYEKPVSLYLVVPPSDIDRMNPVFRMIIELIYRRSTEKMEFEKGKAVTNYKHRLLLLLDEFNGLGRLDTFEKALAYIAGYGLKAMLIVQGLNQLNKTYTRENSIIDNCHVRVLHTPNDAETPKYISEMIGKSTIKVKTHNYTTGFARIFGAGSYSVQNTARELMTPDEVSKMDAEKEIIFIAGAPPINCKKIRYYNDANFTKRCFDAPKNSDIIRKNTGKDKADEYFGVFEQIAAEKEIEDPFI